MFTLIRPFAALAMAALALVAAQAYAPLHAEEANLGRFNLWLAAIAALVGYGFLGSRIGRAPGWAVFYTAQAVALTAVLAAMLFAGRTAFVFGYRRVYREPMEAVEGFFEHTLRYLGNGLDAGFLLLLTTGALVAGIGLHLLFRLLERRRLAR